MVAKQLFATTIPLESFLSEQKLLLINNKPLNALLFFL